MTGTFGTSRETSETIQRSSGLINFASGATRWMGQFLLRIHRLSIILSCCVDLKLLDNVFVEYINQEGRSELSHAISMSVTNVNRYIQLKAMDGHSRKGHVKKTYYKYSKYSSCIMQDSNLQ